MIQNSITIFLVCVLVWLLGSGLDVYSTVHGIRYGLREQNPLFCDKQGEYLLGRALIVLFAVAALMAAVDFAFGGIAALAVNLFFAIVGIGRIAVALNNFDKTSKAKSQRLWRE